jgi:hypothetical protein
MTLTNVILLYLCIGCVIGIAEFFVAQRAFTEHPHADAISRPDMFLTCVLKNAVAWPVLLFWLGALGLLKLVLFVWRPGGSKRGD